MRKREEEEERGGEERGKERENTFLMAARLVMKHTVHKPTLEYAIIPKRFLELVMRA